MLSVLILCIFPLVLCNENCSDCKAGTYCSSTKICVVYDADYCNNNKCGLGDADCDTSDKHSCGTGLTCGFNNCAKYHNLSKSKIPSGANCCEPDHGRQPKDHTQKDYQEEEVDEKDEEECDKSSFVAGLLTFFVGYFGAGQFYYGYLAYGIAQLALGLVAPLFIIVGSWCCMKHGDCIWCLVIGTGVSMEIGIFVWWCYDLLEISTEQVKPFGQPNCDFSPGSDPVGRNVAIGCSIIMSLTVIITTVTAITCCVKKKLCCFKKDFLLKKEAVTPSTPDDSTTTEIPTTTSTDPAVEHDDNQEIEITQL